MKAFRRAQFAAGLLLAALVSIPVAQAERVEDLPQPTDYVSDLAHVLSPGAIAHLDSICAQLDHSKANAQIAIVTIHTLDGVDPAEFANALEDKWKMGRKGSDRGVLIFLAVTITSAASKLAMDWKAYCPTASWATSAARWFPICAPTTSTEP